MPGGILNSYGPGHHSARLPFSHPMSWSLWDRHSAARAKGCWHSSAGPDPAPLASSLSWGGQVERWLCIHRDALAALWWHAEHRSCGAGSNQTFVLLPLAGLSGHHHNSSTTLRPSGAASGIGQAGALVPWLLFHSVHSDGLCPALHSLPSQHRSRALLLWY